MGVFGKGLRRWDEKGGGRDHGGIYMLLLFQWWCRFICFIVVAIVVGLIFICYNCCNCGVGGTGDHF